MPSLFYVIHGVCPYIISLYSFGVRAREVAGVRVSGVRVSGVRISYWKKKKRNRKIKKKGLLIIF